MTVRALIVPPSKVSIARTVVIADGAIGMLASATAMSADPAARPIMMVRDPRCAISRPAASAPPTPPIETARDVPFPGVMKLSIDATDIERRIYKVKQTVPVPKNGPMTLLYPKWVPGGHSPRNSIDYLAGLTITANAGSGR